MSLTYANDLIKILFPPWLLELWADDQIKLALLCLVAAGLVYVFLPGGKGKHPISQVDDLQDVRRPRNTSIFLRLWWRLRPPGDVMRVNGITINRSRKPHAAWLGPTGAGKSSAVAAVRVDGARATLIVTPDLSDPMREACLRLGGFVWSACDSKEPVNFLIGSPTEVAERLTEVFRSGGVGAWKRAARRTTTAVIRDMDEQRIPRNLQTIGERLAASVRKDRNLSTVCAGWVDRFLDLADQFGPSIGTKGLDLADLLNAGQTVLLDVDGFEHPGLGGDVVALGLAEAKRCASRVPRGFRLIFEEAGQLGDRVDLAEPFFRAGRRRKITVDALTHAESDLNEGISANIATRFYFAQELKSLQRIAADRLGLDYRELDPARMKDFSAWLAHGKIRRLVRFPKPPKRAYDLVPTPTQHGSPTTPRITIRELPQAAPALPRLPLPRVEVQEVWEKIDRSRGDCWLWTGSLDSDGYGVQRWEYPNGKKNNRPAHQVVWEIVNGRWFPREPNGKSWDFDHRRTCPRYCVNPAHGEPKPHGDNVRAMHRTRGHVTAAD